ncbi:MAG: hypothetical protein BWZ03_00854 [bacterium ADurb.BinA186]|nr:MAG: hypothetical protein BWZ03_00854 [bacterium ADurb.BinA186]
MKKKGVMYIYKNGAARLERDQGYPDFCVLNVCEFNDPNIMEPVGAPPLEPNLKLWKFRGISTPDYLDFRIFVEI